MVYPIFWVPSPKYTAGHPAPLIAIVHHRMVGTLSSTDSTFTIGTRVASTNFGIGYGCGKTGHPVTAHIHQYVALGNQAWGNGNNKYADGRLVVSQWNSRYPTTLINSRTVSVEHHDNGGSSDPAVKGVVREDVLVASIWLDRLLLSGNLAAMKGAGIRFAGDAVVFARELGAIPVDGNHVIDHNYIAGPLKPYCWRPWSGDKVGFPKTRFINDLSVPVSVIGDVVLGFKTPDVPSTVLVHAGAWLYVNSDLSANAANLSVSPARALALVGWVNATTLIVAHDTQDRAYFLKAVDADSPKPVPISTAPSYPDVRAQLAVAQTALVAAQASNKASIDALAALQKRVDTLRTALVSLGL